MHCGIRIVGFGGQGVILAGVIIAQAAGIYKNLEVVQSQSYGPEARGGAARCDVIISDKRIFYPKIRQPQFLLCMSQAGLERYYEQCSATTRVIIDSTMVHTNKLQSQFYKIDATDIAEKDFNNRMVANMLMLGAFARNSEIIDLLSLQRAVKDTVSPKFLEMNIKAIATGYERVKVLNEFAGVSK
jgi:2-oxoglutarate ferredoxin oxidoreductase subunit gamma